MFEEYKQKLEKLTLDNLGELGVGELIFGLSEAAMTLYAPIIMEKRDEGEFDAYLQMIAEMQQRLLEFDSSVVGSALLATMLFNLFAMWLASLDNPDHMKIEGVEFETRGKEE